MKILVVEDDPGIQNQLKWSLDDHEVTLVDNHDNAMDSLRAIEPTVVLLDLSLIHISEPTRPY